MARQLEDEQRVLSEASHDLANRFHRSYYFLDLLADTVEDGEGGEQLGRLKDTIEEIESIARATLQFLRPLELRPIRVRLEDLVASLRQHVGLRGLDVKGDTAAGKVEVQVDPARISQTLSALAKALAGEGDGSGPLVVEFLGGDPAGVRIGGEGRSAAGADLDLALAARIVRQHGGSLEADDTPDGASSSFTLRLPVAHPGT